MHQSLHPIPKYLPFLSGKYTTSPGLKFLDKAKQHHDRKIFQIDEDIQKFLGNKRSCREENIHKYYLEHQLEDELRQTVNQYLIQQLSKDYPSIFEFIHQEGGYLFKSHLSGETIYFDKQGELKSPGHYLSLFDALCCQIPEDVVIVKFTQEEDWVAATHVCAPSHWAPSEKMGKNFDSLHEPVAGMEKLRKHYQPMLKAIVNGQGYTRFGWSIATDRQLNQHPKESNSSGNHLATTIHADQLYVRVERQNLIGFSEAEAFMFTVRIYFYKIQDLYPDEKQALRNALLSMSDATIQYKGLSDKMNFLLNFLLVKK